MVSSLIVLSLNSMFSAADAKSASLFSYIDDLVRNSFSDWFLCKYPVCPRWYFKPIFSASLLVKNTLLVFIFFIILGNNGLL